MDKEDGKFLFKAGLGVPCPGVSELSGPPPTCAFSVQVAAGEAGGWRLGSIATWWPFQAMQPHVPALGPAGWGQASVYFLGLRSQITEHLLSTCLSPLCACVHRDDPGWADLQGLRGEGGYTKPSLVAVA